MDGLFYKGGRLLLFLLISIPGSPVQGAGKTPPYGFYWSDTENRHAEAFDHRRGSGSNVSLSFYNPEKPVLVYFPSPRNSTISKSAIFRFTLPGDKTTIDTIAPWKKKGWNVLVFYWLPPRESSEVRNMETKIWNSNDHIEGRHGRHPYGTASSRTILQDSYRQYISILEKQHVHNIRFAGHSIGAQLAVLLCRKIHRAIGNRQLPEHYTPRRLALIDPFWTRHGKEYLGDHDNDGRNDTIYQRITKYITEMILHKGLTVAWYKSSAVMDIWLGEEGTSLKKTVAYTEHKYWYLTSSDYEKKHACAPLVYFWSMAVNPPPEYEVNWLNRLLPTGRKAPSAATSTEEIRQMMKEEYRWIQVKGRYTPTPADDCFEKKEY